MRREPFLGLLLVATTLVWGSAFTAIKKIVVVLHPVDLAFVRFLIASLLFGALLVGLARRKGLPQLTAREWGMVVLLGFFGVVGYHVALNGGEALLSHTQSEEVTAILSGFLISMTPLFTLLLAPAFVGERIGGRRGWGALVALAGSIILILWGRGNLIDRDALVGALVVLVAPFSWSLYTLLIKKFLRAHDPLVMTAYTMIAGTLLIAPFLTPRILADAARLSAALWGWILLLSVGATFLGYLAWNYALSHWDAGRVSMFVYLVPLFGLVIATFQAGERLTLQILVGGGLILAGVAWANTRARPTTSPAGTTARAARRPGPRRRRPAPPKPGS